MRFMMLLCVGVLSYKILYWTGQEQFRSSKVTIKDKKRIEALLKDPKFKKDSGIYQINKIKYKPIKPTKC